VQTVRLVHCSELIAAQSALLVLYPFQYKQLGWNPVLNSSQRKQLGCCFLSVQIAWLKHISKLISAQKAGLMIFPFNANCSVGTL
jgi:hypothetical protein